MSNNPDQYVTKPFVLSRDFLVTVIVTAVITERDIYQIAIPKSKKNYNSSHVPHAFP